MGLWAGSGATREIQGVTDEDTRAYVDKSVAILDTRIDGVENEVRVELRHVREALQAQTQAMQTMASQNSADHSVVKTRLERIEQAQTSDGALANWKRRTFVIVVGAVGVIASLAGVVLGLVV